MRELVQREQDRSRTLSDDLTKLGELHRKASEPALLDADHFKGVNDRSGHLVGDQVLRRLAALTT